MSTTPKQFPPEFGKEGLTGWRRRVHEVIYEADTPAGKWFDMLLLVAILLSTLVVMLESEPAIRAKWQTEIRISEWIFTLLFTVEYILRLLCVMRPSKYALSFYGVIDLLAILPTYLSYFLPGAQYLLIIRILRILRIFRILKLALYLSEGQMVLRSLRASSRKIAVFLFTVVVLVTIMGSMMYLIEGETSGFTSIPAAVYWAIVTLTTVGYGDIAPVTTLGRFFASIIMIMGYSMIAVPTGIVTAEMTRKPRHQLTTRVCPHCVFEGHDADADYCKSCGYKLPE